MLACSLCSGLSLCFLPLPCALAGTASLMTQPTLTGNWGGQRQKLEEQGIKLTGDYTSETLSSLNGGIKRGTRYAQQIRLGAQFDLSKLLDIPNAGRVQVLVNDRRGHSATEDLIGNRMSAQEIYGGEYTRLTELSYQRNLFSPTCPPRLATWSWAPSSVACRSWPTLSAPAFVHTR